MSIRDAVAALIPDGLDNKETIIDIVSRLATDSGIKEGDEDDIEYFIPIVLKTLDESFEDIDKKISIGISHGFSGTAQVNMLFSMVRVLEVSSGKTQPS